jgi:hypothetical protein
VEIEMKLKCSQTENEKERNNILFIAVQILQNKFQNCKICGKSLIQKELVANLVCIFEVLILVKLLKENLK